MIVEQRDHVPLSAFVDVTVNNNYRSADVVDEGEEDLIEHVFAEEQASRGTKEVDLSEPSPI